MGLRSSRLSLEDRDPRIALQAEGDARGVLWILQHRDQVVTELAGRKRRAEPGQVRLALDALRAGVGVSAASPTPVPPMICRGTIAWKRMPSLFCSATPLAYFAMNQSMRLAPAYPPESGDPFAAAPLDPTRTRLPGLSGRLSAACIQYRPALTSVSQVAVKSAQLDLVQPAHPRGRAGVQHQDVRADLSENALSGPLVGDVGRDHGDAQPAVDGLERFGFAGDDRHPGAVRNEGLDQSQAKTTASAGDHDSLIFEAHGLSSNV